MSELNFTQGLAIELRFMILRDLKYQRRMNGELRILTKLSYRRGVKPNVRPALICLSSGDGEAHRR